MKTWLTAGIVLLASLVGCSAKTGRIALLSVGDLEGRIVQGQGRGTRVAGEDCDSTFSASPHYLSEAVRDALEGTEYDTIVDAQVTITRSYFVALTCIGVEGFGVDSSQLPMATSAVADSRGTE